MTRASSWTATVEGWYRIALDQPAEFLGTDEPGDDQHNDQSTIVHLEPGSGMTLHSGPPCLPTGPDGVWVDIDWDDEEDEDEDE